MLEMVPPALVALMQFSNVVGWPKRFYRAVNPNAAGQLLNLFDWITFGRIDHDIGAKPLSQFLPIRL